MKPNFTLEFGVRAGYWTNNRELNGLGGYFDPSTYNPNQGQFLDPGTFQRLNGVRYIEDGDAPAGILENRSPFAMPRVNVAWDIDGQGNNVLRGGYGIFYNRNMGNVEYDNTLRLPPYVYSINADAGDGADLRQRPRPDLRHAARSDAGRSRLGSVGINTLTPGLVHVPEDAQLQRLVRAAHSVRPGARSGLRRHARPRSGEPRQRQRRAGRLAASRASSATPTSPTRSIASRSTTRRSTRSGPSRRYPRITQYDFEGESNYNSLQVTLSRQTSKRLQYFADLHAEPHGRHARRRVSQPRSVQPGAHLRHPRRGPHPHLQPVVERVPAGSDQARTATASRRASSTAGSCRASRRSRAASPIWLGFAGPAGSDGISQAYYGTPDMQVLTGPSGNQANGLAPVYTCDPRARRHEGRREAVRHQLHRLPGVRRGRRRAAAVRPADADPHEPRHHAVQELRDQG